MIEGLKLDVKAEELVRSLAERIRYHRSKAESYSAQIDKLGEVASIGEEEEEDVIAFTRGHESPRTSLERKVKEHVERAAILTFLRDHLVPGEVYRLSEQDLRMAEILPGRHAW